MEKIEEKIAAMVSEAGGTAYYVGGFVRDRLLGRECKDVDIEVHGISADALRDILATLGTPLSYGESFGIFSLAGCDIDIAMPRTEKAVGRGHRDFDVSVDPFIGTEAAARRRDFTINALMQDVLSGEITDHFGGLADLEAGIIRHVNDDSFVEDPLRVFRCAGFAARFGFSVAAETSALCRSMDTSALSKERVEAELRKAVLQSERPSVFFECLRDMDQLLPWFSEINDLIGVEQDPVYHPEGDVWTHTMEVVDRAAGMRDQASDPFCFMLLALLHDLGKTVTTEFVNGRIHAYDHENQGLPLAESLLRRITADKSVIRYVMNMIPLHMRPNMCAYSKSSVKSTNRLFDSSASPGDLVLFASADRPVMVGSESYEGDRTFLDERLSLYEEMMARPYVTGGDLIEAGLSPGEDFSDILAYAHKLRLAGTEKESALKQTLSYAYKLRRKS